MSTSMLTLITALGWAGALAGLVAYAMVSKGRWSASSGAFQATNISGAVVMTVVSGANGVWPSAAANIAWIVIGTQTLLVARKNRLAEQAAAVAAVELPLVENPLDLAAAERAAEVVEARETFEVLDALDALTIEMPLVDHRVDHRVAVQVPAYAN